MKYKVGDRVKIKSIDWYNENKDANGDVDCGSQLFIKTMIKFCGKVLTISQVDHEDDYYNIEEDTKFVLTDDMIEGLAEENSTTVNYMRMGKITSVIFHDQNYQDKVELDLGDYELKQEGDKWFAVKKKPNYPRTYEECCQYLGCDDKIKMQLIGQFIRLINARNTYWKIAGEEMGLGKPWEPNWTSFPGYPAIYMFRYQITLSVAKDVHHCLTFPTEEMRDAFYENFKDLIEECKELL